MSTPLGKKAVLIMLTVSLCPSFATAYLSSLNRTDAYPLFSSLDPHTFLHTRQKEQLKGYETTPKRLERFSLSITPFGQSANWGRDIDGDYSSLGDLNGRWSMIPLLFDDGSPNKKGKFPYGKTDFPETYKTLEDARNKLFPEEPEESEIFPGINNPAVIDPLNRFGFFSNNLKYRKKGLRSELNLNIGGGLGICGQIGVADISQVLNDKCRDMVPSYSCIYLNAGRINLTCFAEPSCGFQLVPATDGSITCCNPSDPKYCKYCKIDGFENLTTNTVNKYLMNKLDTIASEIGVDLSNFHATSLEELRLYAYWRRAIEVNTKQREWPNLLFTPFFIIGGSVSPGKKMDPNKLFAAPFGNDGFSSAGFCAGFNFDFYDTIELGTEFGYTNFFKRNICALRIPNNKYQQGLFPFTANVSYQPGCNWLFGAKIACHHFLGKLSTYFQYVMITHSVDKICLSPTCSGFAPAVLEERSKWNTKLANIGFTYDISPNLALGFLWQAPLSQRNTYRSSTVMLSFTATY